MVCPPVGEVGLLDGEVDVVALGVEAVVVDEVLGKVEFDPVLLACHDPKLDKVVAPSRDTTLAFSNTCCI